MQIVRTKWHKIKPLIAADEVYLSAPKGGQAAHLSDYKIDNDELLKLLELLNDLPKFVIDIELVHLATKDDYQHSMLAMKEAGVWRLPFPAMIVEFESLKPIPDTPTPNTIPISYCHYICILRDCQFEGDLSWEQPTFARAYGSNFPFYGLCLRVQKDNRGEYLVVSPSINFMNMRMHEGEPWVGSRGVTWFSEHPDKEVEDARDELVQATALKDAGACFHALSAATLLMNTQGVAKEVIETTKLNRKRVESNKPPIPRHTYIHIGHVYKSASSNEAEPYVPRRSPRPHWRRGHLKTVHIGIGRTGTKQVYINPKLVAYHGPEPEPSMKHDYTVTR